MEVQNYMHTIVISDVASTRSSYFGGNTKYSLAAYRDNYLANCIFTPAIRVRSQMVRFTASFTSRKTDS